MHGLLRCNINAGVHAHARSERVTQRFHNSPRWETGIGSANDVTHRKRAKDLGRFEKVSSVESCLGRRRLTFACSRRPWAGVARDGGGGGRWKSQNRKNVYLSPYVEEPLNSKVIKIFVPELRSRKCFSCFEIPMFYIYMLWTLYVRFPYPYHGYGTYCEKTDSENLIFLAAKYKNR